MVACGIYGVSRATPHVGIFESAARFAAGVELM